MTDWIAEQIVTILKNSRVEIAVSATYAADLSGWLLLEILKTLSFASPGKDEDVEVTFDSGNVCVHAGGSNTWIHLLCLQIPKDVSLLQSRPTIRRPRTSGNRDCDLLVCLVYPLSKPEAGNVKLFLADMESLSNGLLRKAQFSLWEDHYARVQVVGLANLPLTRTAEPSQPELG